MAELAAPEGQQGYRNTGIPVSYAVQSPPAWLAPSGYVAALLPFARRGR